MSAGPDDQWALVLAGGDGVRLQGLTRAITGTPIPKQYCRITGDRSMLEATLDRIAPIAATSRTLAIINRDHVSLAREQLRTLPSDNVLIQERNRDTGPGLLLGLLELGRRAPDATVAVFPSDHYIRDDRTFLTYVARGFDVARRYGDKVVMLGMTPDRVEPSLGYLELGSQPTTTGDDGVFEVAAFVEKPDTETAERIIRRGGLWNTFVMVFRLKSMLALLRRWRPADCERSPPPREARHESAPVWNFSRDFLARVAQELVALRVGDVGWSDWGTPEAIERSLLGMGVVPPWWTAERASAMPAREETIGCG